MRCIFKICGACEDQGEIVMESLTLYICNDQRPSKAWWKLFSIWRILVLDQLEQRWSASPLFITLSSHWNQFILALRSPIKEVKKRKTIRISLRIHPAPFPTAGLTIDALKRGKRVVVVIAETRKSVLEHNRSTWYENKYKILNQANICPAPHNVLPAPYGSEILYRFIPAFNQNFQMPQVDHNVLMMQSIPGTVQVLSCLARRRKRPRPSLKST